MKEKLIKRLYEFWVQTDDNNTKLLEEITTNINNGVEGVEVLLDWCRNDFEGTKEEDPYYEELNSIWNICNWYLDYLNGQIKEDWLLDMIENY